ncbi:MAG: hypothetical protein LBF77_10885 [Spirochaetaceae bacterium]|nr:hypothetical protein [Spirochaetaceae bacterium]
MPVTGLNRSYLAAALGAYDRKAGDMDPRCELSHRFTVSGKAPAGRAPEAILHFRPVFPG